MKTKILNIMTVITLMIFSVLVLNLASCKKDSGSSLAPPDAVLIKATGQQSAATVTKTNEIDKDFNLIVFVPCADGGNGEEVELKGSLHMLFHTTIHGNTIQIKQHIQPQGVSGTGLTSGDKYQGTGVSQIQLNGAFVNGQFESTTINNFRVIGQGTGNNLLVHVIFHVTLNANGVLTAEVDKFSVECK